MNLLSDALRDLIFASYQRAMGEENGMEAFDKENFDELVDEYVERIKNELNVEKYLK